MAANSTDKPWLQDSVLSLALRYWTEKRTGGRLPRRADIDPLELDGALLPYVALVQAVTAGPRRRFRFRLSGTAISAAAGLELTGLYIDALNPNKDYAAYIEGLYERAIEARRPVYSESLMLGARTEATRRTRRLTCPLSSDGQAIDMFFAVQSFEDRGITGIPTLTFAESFRPGPTIVVVED